MINYHTFTKWNCFFFDKVFLEKNRFIVNGFNNIHFTLLDVLFTKWMVKFEVGFTLKLLCYAWGLKIMHRTLPDKMLWLFFFVSVIKCECEPRKMVVFKFACVHVFCVEHLIKWLDFSISSLQQILTISSNAYQCYLRESFHFIVFLLFQSNCFSSFFVVIFIH